MFKALKSLLAGGDEPARSTTEHERRPVKLAVASLLHEATRVDLAERPVEQAAARDALIAMFSVSPEDGEALLDEGRKKARQLTSYFAPVSVIKRELALPERVAFIEHLWRIAYADGRLDPYEDHYVRKIAHLLYVPNTQCMLARGRAAKSRPQAT